MFQSRRSYYLTSTTVADLLWRKSETTGLRETCTAGAAQRDYRQDGCRVESRSIRPFHQHRLLDEMQELLPSITRTRELTGLKWTRTRSEIRHTWQGEEERPSSRQIDQLTLTLATAQRLWVEPIYLSGLTTGRWNRIEKSIRELLEALTHPTVPAGTGPIPVIFSHGSAAVMAHELIGHPAEAQAWAEKLSPLSRSLNAEISSPALTLFDDPTHPDLVGRMEMDDEGYQAKKIPIIREGKLIGLLGDYLHSHLLPCRPGNARVMDVHYFPTARMSNTVIQPGGEKITPSRVSGKKRLEVLRLRDGTFSPDGTIMLTVRLGLIWEGRKITGRVENLVLSGHLNHLLKGIIAIGDDPAPCWSFGECTRSGQTLPVGAESPNVYIEGMEVL